MRTILMASLAICGVSQVARAEVITASVQLGVFDFYYSELYQYLPGFDATLGTLSSITVSTRAYLSETVQVQQASGPLPFTGAFNAIYNAQVIGTPVSDRSILTQSAPTQLNASGIGVVAATFNDSFTIPAADYSINDAPLIIRYDIYAQPQGGLSFPGDNSFYTTAGGTVTVAYTYDALTAVPEPASLALLGAAVTFVLRRKPYAAISSIG